MNSERTEQLDISTAIVAAIKLHELHQTVCQQRADILKQMREINEHCEITSELLRSVLRCNDEVIRSNHKIFHRL